MRTRLPLSLHYTKNLLHKANSAHCNTAIIAMNSKYKT